jgi:ArsR family transcriptional regulator, lead/cadmium/zinc/bismuth-responsive transcriptional repressor
MAQSLTLHPSGPRDVCDVHYVNEQRVKAVQKAMIGDEVAEALAETFKVLSDPTRVKILFALSKAELCLCDLSALLGMNDSAVSHHLRLLKALKLVKYRRRGAHGVLLARRRAHRAALSPRAGARPGEL